MIDLHFHTTLSDGANTSAEVFDEIVRRGLSLVACTDHDIVNREIPALVHEFNRKHVTGFQQEPYIDVVEGVEVSVGHKDGDYEKSLHITLYTKKFSEAIDALLKGIRDGRQEKVRRQCEHLGKIGFEIHTDDILERIPFSLDGVLSRFPESRGDNINNGHLSELITELPSNIELLSKLTNGEVNRENLLDEGLKRGGTYTRIISLPEDAPPYEPTLAAVTALTDRNDTVISVAHPNKTFRTIEEFHRRIGGLVEQGVNAIEVNSEASADWIIAINEIQKKYNLLLTFGSDTHKLGRKGTYEKVLGNMNPHVTFRGADAWREEFLLRTGGDNYRRVCLGIFS